MVRQIQRRIPPLGAATILIAAMVFAVLPGAASASPAVTAQDQCGSTNAAVNPQITIDRPTVGTNETATVNVSGTNFLVPPHQCGRDVFGGVYLFFGWVQPGGKWGPSFRSSTSANGLFGTSYSYPGEGGDAEVRDDGTGAVRLISFTKGGESGTSTPYHMDTNGNWGASVIVRGSTYTFKDVRTGASNTVDCTVVQCGIFTIGAHGKSSRTNERFTPINFTSPGGAPIAPSNPDAGGAGGVTGTPGATSGDPTINGGGQPAGGGANQGTGNSAGSGSNTGSGQNPNANDPAASSADPAAEAGVVGEVAEDTAPAAVESDTAEPEHRDGERASATVFEGDSGSSGSGGLLAIGIAAAVLVTAIGGFFLVRRTRGSGAAKGV